MIPIRFLVFGVSLEALVHRENPGWDESSNAVPLALEQSLSEVERRGLSEVGICEHISHFLLPYID